MKKLLLFACIFIFSCKSKEQKQQDAREKARQDAQELVNKISAPMIANEIGEMNILISTAENTGLPRNERQSAYSELRQKYCGFICKVSVGIDSLEYSNEFKLAVQKQKDLIEAKWKAEAAKQVYKQALQSEYESKE